ncbi:phosphotransferase system enzyme I (PtsP) [Stella humosa]|uniref:phosphoenolpyruvate--protein phosphotransferase n=1 Tax=Stella humosa TaxID=94 RepID=A0A3N1M8N7_9PROT|nr:phosphoenolpyruvate--protein phosphotransferase [Stella humosa]ROQ00061.1 phosphotransferase system enzyme I (PtsP) [Stella humosa]BBK30706.1 phosphoenolpyruvate--protein phosphotransferase [Stella humosa]
METAGGASGSRRLLRRLRDLMASGGTAQERLDRIVTLIAGEMVAEVCSCYIRRAGEVLELFATEGLRPEAVHRTRLRVGEGLVGDIAAHARPLALAQAQTHPQFAYRPETGEEVYHSLMGVPILRGGNVHGVLVVQNRTQRAYTEEESETLQTVAMVLAELVASGDLVNPIELAPAEGAGMLPTRFEGTKLVAGLAMGQAVLHEPRIVIRRIVAEDPAVELDRLREALARMQSALDALLAADDVMAGGEHKDILETYRMFAEDRGWIQRIREAIRGGLTAEAAVQKVQDDTRVRMHTITDPYLRERLLDLQDLTNRLLQHLAGEDGGPGELPADAIVIARTMGPAELLDYDRSRLRGLVLEEGSQTAHVTIVARALDIPVVGGAEDIIARVEPGDLVLVDGVNGQVLLRPGEDVQQRFVEGMRARAQQQAAYAAIRDLPAETLDGQRVALHLNAGLLIDLPQLDATGADGVGLYRTEIPFMVRASFPDVAAQTGIYRGVLYQAGERPVTFRTLDVGGDKRLPYLPPSQDENPALGWRAIRMSLDRPAMLSHQLRALLTAADGHLLRVMFPMVAEVAELEAARTILERERRRLAERGVAPARIEVGVMMEVPSLAFQLDALLPRIDFLSVGSNDLMQFLFACDRGNPKVSGRYDVLSPPALTFLKRLTDACAAGGVPLAVCGEMAARPLEAMALVGLGIRVLSMPAASVGPVKTMVRSLRSAPLASYLERHMASATRSLRNQLKAFAQDHGVIVE